MGTILVVEDEPDIAELVKYHLEKAGLSARVVGDGKQALDLIVRLRATPVVVCPDRLGAINQARLVFAALPQGSRERAELVLVRPAVPDPSVRTNGSMLAELLGAGRVHRLEWLEEEPQACLVPRGIRALARRVAGLESGL